MTVIGITGLARSGKDTVAAVLVEEYGFQRLGFADQLKKLALEIDPIVHATPTTDFDYGYGGEIHNFPGEPELVWMSEIVGKHGMEKAKDQFPEVRRFLQNLGTQARNFLGSDVWIEAWRRALPTDVDTVTEADFGGQLRACIRETVLDTVTPDVRFLNEAAAIQDEDGIIIRVVREGSGLTGSAGQHPSELEQSEIVADYEIENNGTIADLRRAVAAIIGDLSRVAA